jgi:hypothetical protein
MIRCTVAAVLVSIVGTPAFADAQMTSLLGWWVNPSPGNVSLLDGVNEIELSRQGAEQVEGPWPKFSSSRWVKSGNGHYGYGCASLSVVWDSEQVSRIVEARALPLEQCRKTAALRNAEKQAR